VEVDLSVNGIVLCSGRELDGGDLKRAGLIRLPAWRRLLRRLPPGCEYWEASDPRVACFDGQVEIFACRDGYLDPDRQWRTALLLGQRAGRLVSAQIRVIDAVYAAGTFHERFIAVARDRLGEPARNGRRKCDWRLAGLHVSSELSGDALHTLISLAWHEPGADPQQVSRAAVQRASAPETPEPTIRR
jgi:hypothetical protein